MGITNRLLAALSLLAFTPPSVVEAPTRKRRTPARVVMTSRGRMGLRYPEQSDRQALRRYRRAQGGPGLTEGANPSPRGMGIWER